MKKPQAFLLVCIILLLAACAPAAGTATLAPPIQATATNPPTAAPTATQPPTSEPLPSAPPAATATLEPIPLSASFPLSEPGPYYAGTKTIELVDASRGNREFYAVIWYPALEQKDANGRVIRVDAAPDMSGAPYPLILTGPNSGDSLFQSHLASHGLITVIVHFSDFEYSDSWDFGIVDHPRDMLYTLDQLASNPPEGLENVMDTDQVGVTGYSWDGFFSLALSGVRIDPSFYLNWCEQAAAQQPELAEWYLELTCGLAAKWDDFAAHIGDEITAGEDGLWLPVTDERIRAVMPMAVDGAWLYGERGLAAVDRPVFMIQASEDSPYQPTEAAFIFEHLGSPVKSMVSFIGKDHMMVMKPEQAKQMKHFVVAFFGYHLQGREDYREYFSEDFVSKFEDLAWGIYQE